MHTDKRRLLITTGNLGKVVEIRHELEGAGLLGEMEVVGLKDFSGWVECVEDRPTFVGNAGKKARHFADFSGCLTLADDSGLCVDALGGAPGVYSARYAGRHGDDEANNRKLLEALAGVPDEKRGAAFVCSLALADPGGAVRMEAAGSCRGRIIHDARGRF